MSWLMSQDSDRPSSNVNGLFTLISLCFSSIRPRSIHFSLFYKIKVTCGISQYFSSCSFWTLIAEIVKVNAKYQTDTGARSQPNDPRTHDGSPCKSSLRKRLWKLLRSQLDMCRCKGWSYVLWFVNYLCTKSTDSGSSKKHKRYAW